MPPQENRPAQLADETAQPRTGKNIAWVYPDLVDGIHQDFFRMLPPGLELLIYTKLWSRAMMHTGRFDAAAFERRREEILQSAQELVDYGAVDFVAVSGDLIQAAMGPEWNRALCADVERVAGAPATTAMTAVEDALRHLGATRVAIATPFRHDQNEHVRSYLETAGFVVTAILGTTTVTTDDLRRLPADLAHQLAQRAFLSAPGAEAVYIACPVWRGVSACLARLEDELGVPVLSMFTPVLWTAMRALGINTPVPGYGLLLANHS
jgi:maleate cis-trans isomerase